MNSVLVSFSGGQDSTTALYLAKTLYDEVVAVSFIKKSGDSPELIACKKVAQLAEVKHVIIPVDGLFNQLKGSSVMSQIPSLKAHYERTNKPSSYIAGRNVFFMWSAAVLGCQMSIPNIILGVSQTESSGYPDTTQEALDLTQTTLRSAMGFPVNISAPFMTMTKADEVRLAKRLSGCWEGLSFSHTCYNDKIPPCGTCPACILRAKGFREAGEEDPLVVRTSVLTV